MPQLSNVDAEHTDGRPARVIPFLIHQTFKSSDVPQGMVDAASSWSGLNRDHDYRFHDDAAHVELLRDRFDADVLAAYRKITYGAFKADLWRYCVLHEFGGIYADIDTVCRLPMTELLQAEDRFVVPEAGTVKSAVFNAFIAAMPGHPFLAAAIERATRIILSSDSFDGYMTTGPGNLGAAMNEVLGQDSRTPHTPGPHGFKDGSYRILHKHRASDTAPGHVSDGSRTVMFNKYDGYRSDLAGTGVAHWEADRKKSGLLRRVYRRAKRIVTSG